MHQLLIKLRKCCRKNNDGEITMEQEPLVTIVIPTYNAKKTVKKCLTSLKNQETNASYQVLVVNDGSTDETENIVKRVVGEDTRFTLLTKKNSGLSETRNYGVQHTTTKYITFMDPDDYVEANYIDKLIEPYLHSSTCTLSITGYQKERENGEIIFKSENTGDNTFAADDAFFKIFVAGGFEGFTWNKLYCTNIIKNNKLKFDNSTEPYEDLYFDLQYLKYCKQIVWNNVVTYHYIVHNNSAIHSDRPGNVFNFESPKKIDVLKRMIPLIPDENERALDALKSKICWDELSIFRAIYAAPNKDEVPVETIKKLRDDISKYRQPFLHNEILSKKDKVIFWLNWYCPSLFAWIWNTFNLHGRG